MVSDMTSIASLVQQAPAMAVAILALLFGIWSHRQKGRSNVELEARLGVSNVRQGRRLGAAETAIKLLDMRRRITEEELSGHGIRLSPWPPDGPLPYPRDDDEDQAVDLDTAHLETQYFIPPRPAPRRTS